MPQAQGTAYFLPDFLIPPVARGPFPTAFAFSSSSFFCSSFCFCLNALSSLSISLACFLGCFRGSSWHFCSPIWRLLPLSQTLPPEAELTSAFFWQNSISLCPASFRTPRPNFPVTPVLISYFCIPVLCNEKDILFWVLVLEGLVGLHRTIQLLQPYWLGHKLALP